MDSRIQKGRFVLFLAAFCLGVILFAAAPGEAGWWVFGSTDDVPEFIDLKFNSINVENVTAQIDLAPEDLASGLITIRGRTDVGQGTVGKVEVSFNGGEKWQKATLGDRGMFTLEFKPELQKEYNFQIKALSTTGKSSDLEDHSFTFIVGSVSNTNNIKAVFMELLRSYMAEDRAAFMRLVHPDFEGDLAALEDAISDDFLYFDNIRIEPNITRTLSFDGNYELYFTFSRQVQVANTGSLLKDSSASSMTFARGSGFKLFEMAAPLIFGVSNPAELATNVTEEAIGSAVLDCNNDGDCNLAEQGDEAVADGGSSETATLQDTEGILFATGGIVDDFSADINFETNIFLMDNGASWAAMANGSFDTTTRAPAGTYGTGSPSAVTGTTFAVKLNDSTYALVEVEALTGIPTCVINYRYPVPGP